MPKKRPPAITQPRWNWSDGWRAAAWAVLCAEAILAGGDRPCMSAFNIENLLGDMLAMHAVGVAEALGLCTTIPAFAIAAGPWAQGYSSHRRIPTLVGITVAALILQLFIGSPFVWMPVFGVVIGLLITWFPWVQSNWIVVALVTAAALGVIEFSGLQYSHNRCWP